MSWVTIWLPVRLRMVCSSVCTYIPIYTYISIGIMGNYLVTRETVYREVKDFRDVRDLFLSAH